MSVLSRTYGDLVALVEGLGEDDQWTPTGCAGWCVRDLVFHLLGDAQRALVALATPADGPPDTTASSYWRDWQPGSDAAETSLRMTRMSASAWSRLEPLGALYTGTARAVLVASQRVDPAQAVRTQGHVLAMADLLDTLAVEAAVHHLDLVAHLDRPGPGREALALVRATAEALLGEPFPEAFDDREVALMATGRGPAPTGRAPAPTGRAPAPTGWAGRLPLFG